MSEENGSLTLPVEVVRLMFDNLHPRLVVKIANDGFDDDDGNVFIKLTTDGPPPGVRVGHGIQLTVWCVREEFLDQAAERGVEILELEVHLKFSLVP